MASTVIGNLNRHSSRRLRAAGAILGGLAVLAAALPAATGQATDRGRRYPVTKSETIARTLRFPDASGKIEVIVDNVYGDVRVHGTSGSDVVLEAKKTIYARDEARAARAAEEVTLDVLEKDGTVDIFVDGPFRERQGWDRTIGVRRRDPGYEVHYDFDLRVPARAAVDVSTVNGGDVLVESIEGDFIVHNVNGPVRLTGVAGAGEAVTVNGGVAIQFTRTPAGDCLFKTINGDVEVAFPAEPSADFRVKTWHGDVFTDFEVTNIPARPAAGERKEGLFVFKSDGYSGVRIGRGGPEIRLDTMNGDILIKHK